MNLSLKILLISSAVVASFNFSFCAEKNYKPTQAEINECKFATSIATGRTDLLWDTLHHQDPNKEIKSIECESKERPLALALIAHKNPDIFHTPAHPYPLVEIVKFLRSKGPIDLDFESIELKSRPLDYIRSKLQEPKRSMLLTLLLT